MLGLRGKMIKFKGKYYGNLGPKSDVKIHFTSI